MKLRNTLFASVAALGLMTVAAEAVPISGGYTLTVNRVTSDMVDLSQASAIYFTGSALTPANTLSSFIPNSNFVPSTIVACGNCGTINNITGIPAGTATSPFTAVSPLFTVQGLSFSLTSLTQVLRSTSAAGSSLELKGTGLYTAANYDNTVGTFDITIQNGTATIMTDSASASGNVAATVPEPASLALIGGALATVGLIRRRRTNV